MRFHVTVLSFDSIHGEAAVQEARQLIGKKVQEVKGIAAASHIVKPGGTILLVAACREGLGSPEFAGLVRRASDWRVLLDELEKTPVEVDQWQAEKLAMVAEKARLSFCVPGVAAEDRQHLWGPTFETPQEAVEDLVAGLPAEASLVVIPEGPYVFSQVSQTPVAVA